MNADELFIDAYKLPKPLNKSEIYELFRKMEQGDQTAKEKIAMHNIRLVIYEVVNKFKFVKYDKKDLISIGNIGLMNAINTFDISRNVEFATYATRCIDNEILMHLRNTKKDKNIDSLDRTINYSNDGNELKLKDVLKDNTNVEDDYTHNEVHSILRNAINNLPDRDKQIIMMSFGFYDDYRYTQYEIAEKLNLSQSYVSRLIDKIVKRLGNNLKEQGVIELREYPKINAEFVKDEREKTVEKDLQAIYEYFDNYSSEEINTMLGKLTEEERELIILRYNENLGRQNSFSEWILETHRIFYNRLLPKMKKLLDNPNIDELESIDYIDIKKSPNRDKVKIYKK